MVAGPDVAGWRAPSLACRSACLHPGVVNRTVSQPGRPPCRQHCPLAPRGDQQPADRAIPVPHPAALGARGALSADCSAPHSRPAAHLLRPCSAPRRCFARPPCFWAHLGAGTAIAQELPRTDAAEAGFSRAGIERLDTFLNDYTSNGSLPGAVAMVLRDGAVAYEKAAGYRDIESGDRMRPDAIFRIASQTKAIVSVAVMILQDEGALLISDRVGRYLPAFARTTVAVPNREGGGYEIVGANRPITIRDLLTHTAGIAYGNGPGGDRWREAEITGWVFRPPGRTGSRHRRPHGRASLPGTAGIALRLRIRHRHPRGAGGRGLRAPSGRVSVPAHLRAARHARHPLLPAARQAASAGHRLRPRRARASSRGRPTAPA